MTQIEKEKQLVALEMIEVVVFKQTKKNAVYNNNNIKIKFESNFYFKYFLENV
jgi:hypothetical protein